MAVSFACNCAERKKPIKDREWYVTQRNWNSGAFTSGAGEPSDYSQVWCVSCHTTGRTKAQYVNQLSSISMDDLINRLDTKETT
ncbi:hypothetical protein [uncultured Paraglaciecola sp.]|uniref:hypothetical protein n=1 Tax=uncultured Paraglaciecola sp. TaxID=1765024 RepID=UPI00260332A6|nr:hypothetical protein [uncultured Paraglaciecola sp.]